MSVEIEGPKGYEFQYLVSLCIWLLNQDETTEFYIEAKEDAEIILTVNGIKKIYEIQVKKENSDLNESLFANWICHFEDHKSDSNLLERITKDRNRFVIFATMSRCTDTTSIFLRDGYTSEEKIPTGKKEDFNSFWEAIAKIEESATKGLKKKRHSYCKKQADDLFNQNVGFIKNILSRIVIWEKITKEDVERQIKSCLSLKNIPFSKFDSLIRALLDIIKEDGRNKSLNIVTKLNEEIDDNKFYKPPLENYYLDRIEEPDLLKKLDSDNVLLLTGLSFSGKTQVGVKIALAYIQKGFHPIITSNLDTGIKFIRDLQTQESRIVLLEDPFGHILDSNSRKTYNELENFLKTKLQNNRKLIITSKIELLIDLNIQRNSFKLHQYIWHDLTVIDRKLLINIWNKIKLQTEFPKDIDYIILDVIAKSEHLPQPGQLNQLVLFLDELEGKDKNWESISKIIYKTSKTIADDIISFGDIHKNLFLLIGMMADTIHTVKTKDLSFILNSPYKENAWLRNQQKGEFPEYDPKYKDFTDPYKQALLFFERKGYISQDDKFNIKFRHPNYEWAAKYLIFVDHTRASCNKTISFLSKAINSLNFHGALRACNLLKYIYIEANTIEPALQKRIKRKLIKLGFKGLSSNYLAVQDKALDFLLENIKDLLKKEFEEINRYLRKDFSVNNLYWKNDIPFLHKNDFYTISDFSETMERKKLQFEKSKIIVNEITLKIQRMQPLNESDLFHSLIHIKETHDIVLLDKLKDRFKNSSHSIIRGNYVYLVFLYNKQFDDQILQDIFSDKNPDVIYYAMKGIVEAKFDYAQDIQIKILSYLKRIFHFPQYFLKCSDILLKFDELFQRNDDNPKRYIKNINDQDIKRLWIFWGELSPFVFEYKSLLPIDTDNFYSLFEKAKDFIELDKAIIIFEKWYNCLEALNQKYVPDASLFDISSLFITYTTNNNIIQIREKIFKLSLKNKNTSFTGAFLCNYLDCWEYLSDQEKEIIYTLLQSNRPDKDWLSAIAISVSNPPKEILNLLIGDTNYYVDKNYEKIIDELNKKRILEKCVNLYCNKSFFYALNFGRNKNFWDNIIMLVLKDKKNHNGFEIALSYMILRCMNSTGEPWWSNYESIWKIILENSNDKKVIIYSLIDSTIKCCPMIPPTNFFWTSLMNSLHDEDKEFFCKLIIENLESIEYSSSLSLYEILDYSFIESLILPKTFDKTIIQLYSLLSHTDGELRSKTFSLLTGFLKEKSLKATFQFLQSKLEKEFNEDFLKKLEEIRLLRIDTAYKIRNRWKEKEMLKLDDWVDDH
jgi:hypothetical protein